MTFLKTFFGAWIFQGGMYISIHNFSTNLSDTKSQFHAKGSYTMDSFFISNPKSVQQYIICLRLPAWPKQGIIPRLQQSILRCLDSSTYIHGSLAETSNFYVAITTNIWLVNSLKSTEGPTKNCTTLLRFEHPGIILDIRVLSTWTLQGG